MYSRQLGNLLLEFGHAGILHEQSFVMYDKQTDSLWVHVTGQAVAGELTGAALALIPSTVTTWQLWRQRHPETLVLGGLRLGGFIGTYGAMGGRDDEVGQVVVLRGKARLYPYRELRARPLRNDRLDQTNILVFYNDRYKTAYVWNRQVGDRTLTFETAGRQGDDGQPLFLDRETGSLWSWLAGKAVSGPMQGAELLPLPSHPILTERYKIFYPHGD